MLCRNFAYLTLVLSAAWVVTETEFEVYKDELEHIKAMIEVSPVLYKIWSFSRRIFRLWARRRRANEKPQCSLLNANSSGEPCASTSHGLSDAATNRARLNVCATGRRKISIPCHRRCFFPLHPHPGRLEVYLAVFSSFRAR